MQAEAASRLGLIQALALKATNMAHYYHLDTSGEDTNLQLYCLKQAMKYWGELQDDLSNYGEDAPDVRERCVFILSNLGLSVSQLLGQNNPSPSAKVPYPLELVSAFVDEHGLDPNLKADFERFNYFYNGCRHFGRTTNGSGYSKIDQLTLPVAEECYSLGLDLWLAVISVFRQDPKSDLAEFDLMKLVYEC
jgi:hypothetical protein